MMNNKVVTVVLPAYNAAKTLQMTYQEIPFHIVDHVVLVDDCSKDNTVEIAQHLGIKHILLHDVNRGYGANQKSCYRKAMEIKSDIVVMLHPDYQYTPKLIESMCSIISNEVYPVVFGSRILGGGALKGGMPLYKYVANRALTYIQNLLMNCKLSEYHTGYRAYSVQVLKDICFETCSDDFIFDNEIIAQIIRKGYDIGEITCPSKYHKEASSINVKRSIQYGFGVLRVSFGYFFDKLFLRIVKGRV